MGTAVIIIILVAEGGTTADEGEPELPDLWEGAVRCWEDRGGEVLVAQKLLQMQDMHKSTHVNKLVSITATFCTRSTKTYQSSSLIHETKKCYFSMWS